LHWTAALGAGVMLFAHWLYLIAAMLKMIDPVTDEGNVHTRGNLVMERRNKDTSTIGEIDHVSADGSKLNKREEYSRVSRRSLVQSYMDLSQSVPLSKRRYSTRRSSGLSTLANTFVEQGLRELETATKKSKCFTHSLALVESLEEDEKDE